MNTEFQDTRNADVGRALSRLMRYYADIRDLDELRYELEKMWEYGYEYGYSRGTVNADE